MGRGQLSETYLHIKGRKLKINQKGSILGGCYSEESHLPDLDIDDDRIFCCCSTIVSYGATDHSCFIIADEVRRR